MAHFFARPLAVAIHQAVVSAMLVTGSLTAPQTAIAQNTSKTYAYDIPAMSLDRALTLFSAQSEMAFAFNPKQVLHLQSRGLKGSYGVDDGFKALLAPHGLQAQKTDKGYVIVRMAKSSVIKRASGNAEQAGRIKVNQPSQANENPVTMTPIKVTAQGATPSSIHISREEMDRYGNISTGDVLKGVPGVQVGDSRNGGGVDVNIRGVQGQERIVITVDGARQGMDAYRGYAGTQQRSYFDPDLISRINITKGPNNAGAPAGGIGGTVAMSTLMPADILLPGKKSGFRVTGELMDNSVKPAPRGTDPIPDESKLLAISRKGKGDFLDNSAKAGTAAYAWQSDKIDLVAAYARRKQGNYFAGKHGYERYRIFDEGIENRLSTATSYAADTEVLNSSSETESWLLKSIIRPADGHKLQLGYRRFEGKFGEIMPSDIFRRSNGGIYQYPPGEIKIDTVTARYAYEPADQDLIHLNGNLWWTHTKSEQLNGSFAAPPSQIYFTDRAWMRLDNQRVGGDLSNRFDFSTRYGLFSLNLGSSFQYEDIRPQKSVEISIHDRHMNQIVRDAYRSAFDLNAQLDFHPTDQLHLWAGGRFSSFHTQDRNQNYTTIYQERNTRYVRAYRKEGEWGDFMRWFPDENGNFTDATDPRLHNALVFKDSNNPFAGIPYDEYGAVGTQVYDAKVIQSVTGFEPDERLSANDHGFAPAFGLNYEILPQTSLYASYTNAVRMPSLFDTTMGTQQIKARTGLKPERMRAWEIGANTQLDNLLTDGDSASFKLAYFNTNIKNYITRYYDPNTMGVMTMSNTDNYRIDGLEFQSNYDNGGFFTDLSATYYFATETCDHKFAAYLRSVPTRYQQTQDTPDCTPGSYMGSYTNTQNPPKFAARLSLGQRLLDKRLTVGGRISYTSGPTTVVDKPWQMGVTTPQLEYHPVTLLDAFMNYQLKEGITLNASLQNITNRYYLDALAQSYMPSPGRTFRAGLTMKF
ncbi:TonB-dependent receptor domain-containing protein [Acinetobacter sp. WZC-1]|uniref:TonB-dependent receptor domain-containing protein n=1 Tax=Acinetobacter sp. WZC-1 TaxID=3459034 RepID=UPI00403D94CA